MEWKREHAAKLYSEGRITLERAAMEAGISVRETMEYLKPRKIPAQYEIENLEEDMKRFITDWPNRSSRNGINGIFHFRNKHSCLTSIIRSEVSKRQASDK